MFEHLPPVGEVVTHTARPDALDELITRLERLERDLPVHADVEFGSLATPV
jgi:hypothetical protein